MTRLTHLRCDTLYGMLCAAWRVQLYAQDRRTAWRADVWFGTRAQMYERLAMGRCNFPYIINGAGGADLRDPEDTLAPVSHLHMRHACMYCEYVGVSTYTLCTR